jgi:hypothetical protein
MKIQVVESKSGIGLAGLLGIAFIVLKLTGTGEVATWGWGWVLAPFWMPMAIVLGIMLAIAAFVAVVASVAFIVGAVAEWRKDRRATKEGRVTLRQRRKLARKVSRMVSEVKKINGY